jgi:transcriptional regulator with XRE-family HTH domain
MPADAASTVARRRRLVQRRKALGLTQEALAELMAVGRSTVVRWERGESEPLPWIRPKLTTTARIDLLLAMLRGCPGPR